MALQNEIEKWSATIHTDGYSMSFGELLNLYDSNELDIHPEFQRFYRWDIDQKSRLIESLLLGIPLPSIFVTQRSDGVWDVIDGLQRLSTVFQLVGTLRDENNDFLKPLILKPTRYLPSLENKSWDGSTEGTTALSQAQRLYIKRSKIDVKIIKKESDPKSKYELFQRLNTGGSPLSDQELRNCILISIDPDAFAWLQTLGTLEGFSLTTWLTDRSLEERFDLDLITRFLLFLDADYGELKQIGDVNDYVTSNMVEAAQKDAFVNSNKRDAFVYTFNKLANTSAGNSFRRYRTSDGQFVGGFLISAYESVALGIGRNKFQNSQYDIADEEVESRIKQLWADEEFLGGIGSGVRAAQRIPVTVPKGTQLFK